MVASAADHFFGSDIISFSEKSEVEQHNQECKGQLRGVRGDCLVFAGHAN
jgi:hypothetical protein